MNSVKRKNKTVNEAYDVVPQIVIIAMGVDKRYRIIFSIETVEQSVVRAY